MLVTSKTYVGDPIRCWCPAQFTDSHKHYTNNICWVSHTYYIPSNKQVRSECIYLCVYVSIYVRMYMRVGVCCVGVYVCTCMCVCEYDFVHTIRLYLYTVYIVHYTLYTIHCTVKLYVITRYIMLINNDSEQLRTIIYYYPHHYYYYRYYYYYPYNCYLQLIILLIFSKCNYDSELDE